MTVPTTKGKKPLPKKIGGIPLPVVVVGGVAVVAYLYLRHSSVASGVQKAGTTGTKGGGRGGRGPAGPAGRAGKAGRTIRKTINRVVVICPPGYHKGPKGKHCIPNKRHHPAHHKLARQRG
jgi:hypothetical protein